MSGGVFGFQQVGEGFTNRIDTPSITMFFARAPIGL